MILQGSHEKTKGQRYQRTREGGKEGDRLPWKRGTCGYTLFSPSNTTEKASTCMVRVQYAK